MLKMEINTYATLTIVGSHPSHSAIPEQTPAIIEFLDLFKDMLSL